METPFAQYLLDKMTDLDLNDSQLAAKVGVNRSTVGRWVNDGLMPKKFETLKKLSDGLDVPLQEIIDAIEGNYKPLTQPEREALEIRKKYSPEALKLACQYLENASTEDLKKVKKQLKEHGE